MKNLIFITSYAGNFNGQDYKNRKEIYGSELACINIALQLSKWYNVIVFVNDDIDRTTDNVRYVRWSDYNSICNQYVIDICIVSRYINFFLYNKNHAKKVYIWVHDKDIHPAYNGTVLPENGVPLLFNILPQIDKIVCVGKTQMDELFHKELNLPYDKLCYIPNGITRKESATEYKSKIANLEKLLSKKRKNSFVFCSSPDRHLSILLKLFPKITEILGNATLDIYYSELPNDCKILAKDQKNVKVHGKVSHDVLMKELERIEYWVYPTKFFETCCTTAFETAYHGCLQITTKVGALKENIKGIVIDLDPDSEAFEQELLKTLESLTPELKKRIVERQYLWAIEQTWENRGLVWQKLIETGDSHYVVSNSVYEHISKNSNILPYHRVLKNKTNVDCEWYDALTNFLNTTYEYLSLDVIHPQALIDTAFVKGTKCCFITESTVAFSKRFETNTNTTLGVILNRKGVEMVLANIKKEATIFEIVYSSFGANARSLITGELSDAIKKPEISSLLFTIGCAIMVKNEEKTIKNTLNSIVKYVDCIVIYDTGSTDKTIDICQDFCKENNVTLHLKQDKKFIDFATSRNIMLKFADDKADYLLLLDAADELQNGELIYKTVLTQRNKYIFRVTQIWSAHGAKTKYDNFRFIKTGYGIMYDYPVHEVLSGVYMQDQYIGDLLNVVLYQDRTVDLYKSRIRWVRDKDILLKERVKRPKDSRVIFYLAQTYKSLNIVDMAVATYKQRIDSGGYIDEIEQSYIDIYELIRKIPDKRKYMYEMLTQFWNNHKRGEAAYFIADELIIDFHKSSDKNADKHYIDTAYDWAMKAYESDKPKTHLWVNHAIFDHDRYQAVAIVCYYCHKTLDIGLESLKKAVLKNPLNNANKQLLEVYSKL
jgi:glycosyltransferase involved in cell wall biosynthesis